MNAFTADPSHVMPRTWFDKLIDALAAIAGAGLCGLTVLICVDVAARKLSLFAMPWSLDVAEYSLLVITFFGAPWVLVHGGHISIDIVTERLRPERRRRVAIATNFLCVVVCAALLWFSMGALWRSFSQGNLIHETWVFPEWWLLAVPPPIFLILMGIFLRWLRRPREVVGSTTSDGI
jgi:TRAP-type C4-dicarboxylate transport system permease small subunit